MSYPEFPDFERHIKFSGINWINSGLEKLSFISVFSLIFRKLHLLSKLYKIRSYFKILWNPGISASISNSFINNFFHLRAGHFNIIPHGTIFWIQFSICFNFWFESFFKIQFPCHIILISETSQKPDVSFSPIGSAIKPGKMVIKIPDLFIN